MSGAFPPARPVFSASNDPPSRNLHVSKGMYISQLPILSDTWTWHFLLFPNAGEDVLNGSSHSGNAGFMSGVFMISRSMVSAMSIGSSESSALCMFSLFST